MANPKDETPPFPLRPLKDRNSEPTVPGIGVRPLPPALPRMSGPVRMPSPFPPGRLQEQLPKPERPWWRRLLTRRGITALAVLMGLAADAVGTAYPQVTGVIGLASKGLELAQKVPGLLE
jgi:hypothetical protein